MAHQVRHDMAVTYRRDEIARQGFVTGARRYVLNDLARHLRTTYERKVQPAAQAKGTALNDGPAIHKAMKPETMFKFYSTLRGTAQELVWRSVLPGIEREAEDLAARADSLGGRPGANDAMVSLQDGFKVPRSVTELDVHLMPGAYQAETFPGDVSQGALYDNGLSVFLMGYLGPDMDDTGRSVSRYLKARFPTFAPRRMLDIGCTIGFNTLPWQETYPGLVIDAIDPCAPNLRYGAARTRAKGHSVHYHQMIGEDLKFADASFDLVWSAMVLHEMTAAGVRQCMQECFRVLKPGGLMIHMELPPNSAVPAYEQFYLDWDAYYNKEPWYKKFRDTDLKSLVTHGGFAAEKYFYYVIPSHHNAGDAAVVNAAIADAAPTGGNVGRLADGLRWFTFGAWK
ncbi:MAG: class I SAM-dependent methyltransferase [Rhodospirillaceae bacterium]|nr:class I SAM-dependent methyltransferase [Rhodospirillaceae bacterium]